MNRATIYASIGAAAAIAVGALGFTPGAASATPTTGFLQTGAGPYDYNTAANWVGGTINGVWDSSLTLTASQPASQLVTIGATPSNSTGLSFAYAGSGSGSYNLTLENTGGSQTFYLAPGAGIIDNTGGGDTVSLNSLSNTSTLTIDLGGGQQTIGTSVTSAHTTYGSKNTYLDIGAILTDGSVITASDSQYVTITGLNTYTGATTITSGQWTVATLANGGVASALGESSNAASNLVITGSGLLAYNGSGPASTDRLFTIGTGANVQTINGALTFTNTGALAFSNNNIATKLTLGGHLYTTATGTLVDNPLTFDPQITNDGTGKTSVLANGGTVVLANANNSYTGATTMNGYSEDVTLEVANLQVEGSTGGVASDIGASSNAAANLVFGSACTLEYTGAGSTTDRNMEVYYTAPGRLASTNIFTVNSSGTGALVMTGAQTYEYFVNNSSTQSDKNTVSTMGMVLDGTSAANLVNQYNGAIANGVTPATSPTYFVTALYTVTKSGTNTWALGGTNTYTGATTVNGGALLITGSLASGSAVTVNTGGTLGGSGTIGGSVTLAAGGILQPSFDSALPTTLTVGSLTAGSGSTIDLTVSGASTDSVVVTTSGGLTYAGTLAIADATPQAGVFQLFSFTGSPAGDFSAVTVNGTSLTDPIGTWTGTSNGFDFSFVESTGVLTVSGTAIPEPAALSLMSLAGLGILLLGRKRKSA